MKHCFEADSIILRFGNRTILSDIYVKSETGKITGLAGNNGSGKSSLLKVIFGVLEPESKSIRVDGEHIFKPYLKKGVVNYLPQHSFLPSTYKISKVFKDHGCNLQEFCNVFELDIKGADRVFEYHHSTIRLIEIYILIHANTMFTFLDEPFTHLSPILTEKVYSYLENQKSRKGIIVTDHRFATVRGITDDFYLLNKGSLRPVDIKDREMVYRDLFQ